MGPDGDGWMGCGCCSRLGSREHGAVTGEPALSQGQTSSSLQWEERGHPPGADTLLAKREQRRAGRGGGVCGGVTPG